MVVILAIAFLVLHTAAGRSSQCAETVLRTWCTNDLTQNLAGVYYQCERDFTFEEKRCRVNERGQLCGLFVNNLNVLKEAQVACSNSSNCTMQCKQLLQQLKEDLGCCINEMLNVTSGPEIFTYMFEYELWKNCDLDFPNETCQPSMLAMIPKSNIATQDCSFHEFHQKRYQIQCSNSKIKALADAFDKQNCNQVSQDLYTTCTVSDEGTWCIEDFLKKIPINRLHFRSAQMNCDGSGCSQNCKNELLQVKANLGCCFNFILNNTFFELIYSDYAADNLVRKAEIWDKCEVPQPQDCKVQTYSGGGTSLRVTTATLVMVVILTFL